MKTPMTRRNFLQTATVAGAGLTLARPALTAANSAGAPAVAVRGDKPAKLGGQPLGPGFPSWPVFDQTEEQALQATLRSRQWFRGSGKAVAKFEEAYEKLTGARHCLATASGTAALSTALGALDVGPGDEVILPPYTFIATYNVVALNYALPVFADIDLETFQVDPARMEAAITPNTRALLPVHLGGYPVDLDRVLALGQKHQVPVVEDACQAHLAEWRGRKVGTWGLAGCFSFQASKNLNSGEGGALLTNDDAFAESCYNFHNQGRGRKSTGYNFVYSGTRGSNLRLAEFQGSLLTAQMTRVVEQANRRTENAAYLTRLLAEIPGIKPARLYPDATRSAYHLYMFRYDPAPFAGLSRAGFLAAMSADGIPCSGGYGEMNKEDYVSSLAQNRHFLKLYGETRLKAWLEQNRNCPENEKLCRQAVWFTQNMLLGPREDMDKIAAAVRRIQQYGAELAKGI